ncbi:2730_t:CDS:2, partial [Gigaspora margarita]
LIRHKRYSHNTYNIPRANLISLPKEAINEFKRTIVYLIQHQLSNHTWYAPTQQTYECVFMDNNWGIRHYTENQQTAVILFTRTQTDQEIDDNMKNSGCNTFSQDQNAAKFKMKVKWE